MTHGGVTIFVVRAACICNINTKHTIYVVLALFCYLLSCCKKVNGKCVDVNNYFTCE